MAHSDPCREKKNPNPVGKRVLWGCTGVAEGFESGSRDLPNFRSLAQLCENGHIKMYFLVMFWGLIAWLFTKWQRQFSAHTVPKINLY